MEDKAKGEDNPEAEGFSENSGVDLVLSVILLIFSTGVSILSLHMERPRGWLSAPGLIPLFISLCLAAMAIALLIPALKDNGIHTFITGLTNFPQKIRSKKFIRSSYIIGLTTIYVLILGRVPFEIASFLYLFMTLSFFWKQSTMLSRIIISISVPVVLTIIFRLFFSIFMPGQSIWEYFIFLL